MKVLSLAFFRSEHSGYESEAAGAGRGVFFVGFLAAVLRAWNHSMPGWKLWVHHDARVTEYPYFRVMKALEGNRRDFRLVPMGKAETLCGSMLWRLAPILDPDVETVACRDIDSLPMPRDFKMLEEFHQNSRSAHAILDSESHCGPFMGGMSAFNAARLREALGRDVKTLDELFRRYPIPSPNQHGADQIWMNANLWPRLGSDTFIHQKRADVLYPSAAVTRRTVGQECEEDRLANHIGGAYEAEKVVRFYDEKHPWPLIREIEKDVIG